MSTSPPIELRPERPEDHEGIDGVVAAAFLAEFGSTSQGGLGLAPVAVAPDQQRAGLGGMLINESLARATQAGWRFVVLLGHDTYYPRFGFRPAAPLGLTGDYGDHDGWMVRSLGEASPPTGHARYCSAFLD